MRGKLNEVLVVCDQYGGFDGVFSSMASVKRWVRGHCVKELMGEPKWLLDDGLWHYATVVPYEPTEVR